MSTEAADALHKILIERKLTIACAESLTVGGVARHLGENSGSSAYFQGGIVAYNIDHKANILGVDRENAEACNCVSKQTAIEMVYGVMKLFDSDVGIATTGYAEPDPENGIDKPFAWIAVGIRNPEDRNEADIHHISATVDPKSRLKEDRRVDVQESVAYSAVEFCVNCLAPGTLEVDK
jgi:PncC family amidohydrolase